MLQPPSVGRHGPLLFPSFTWKVAALAGCLLLALAGFNFRHHEFASGAEELVIPPGQYSPYHAYLSPGFSVAQNTLRHVTLAWTNTKRLPSALEVLPRMETNQFRH